MTTSWQEARCSSLWVRLHLAGPQHGRPALFLSLRYPQQINRSEYFLKSRVIVALFTALLISSSGWGQRSPNFSGNWKLDVVHSDYGDLQGPSSRTDSIKQHDGEITETIAAIQKHKMQSYILRFSTDGRKTVFPEGAEIHIPPVHLRSISAVWKGNTLVVTESLHFDEYDIPARYLYDLSSDGNTLTMTLYLGEAEPAATFVFDRSTSNSAAAQ